MSRDGNGNYSLPSTVNPVQDATQITTTWANSTLNDIATALTNSLVADGQKPMTAPLKFSDGTVAAPAITFNSEDGSGWYRVSSGTLAEAIGGVQVATSTASTRTFKTAVVLSGSNSLTVGGDAAITGDATIGGTLDITGNVTFDGSLTGSGAALTSLNASNLASGTVPSGRLSGTYSINISGNAATATSATSATSATNATNATNVAITNDTATNSTHYIHFGDATSSNDGVKVSSSKLTFNPSTGVLTATGFAGPLTGNVTGNVSGSSGSTTGNAATATKLATARTIDITGVTATGQSFDGTGNISIPVTAVPATLLTGTVASARLSGTYSISISGNAATATNATPTSVTLSSTNTAGSSSHTHAFAPGGSTSQYIRGNGSLATFPFVPTLASGTYTPTVTNVSNVSDASATAQYMRVGDVVTVSGVVTFTASGSASWRISLPVSSNLGAEGHLAGLCQVRQAILGVTVAIVGDASNNAALFVQPDTNIGTGTYTDCPFTFTYRVI